MLTTRQCAQQEADRLRGRHRKWQIVHHAVINRWSALPLVPGHIAEQLTADTLDELDDAIAAFQAQCREQGCHQWT